MLGDIRSASDCDQYGDIDEGIFLVELICHYKAPVCGIPSSYRLRLCSLNYSRPAAHLRFELRPDTEQLGSDHFRAQLSGVQGGCGFPGQLCSLKEKQTESFQGVFFKARTSARNTSSLMSNPSCAKPWMTSVCRKRNATLAAWFISPSLNCAVRLRNVISSSNRSLQP